MATGRGSGLDSTFTAYDVPLSAVMKWPPANYTNPHKRHWFVPFAAVLHAITTVVMGMRIWTRLWKRPGSWGADDILIIVAYTMSSAMYGLGAYGVLHGGLDRHVWDVRAKMTVKAGLIGWIIEIIFICALCLVKISVLVFFRRLMDRTHSKRLILAIHAGIFMISAYWISFSTFFVLACSPVDSAWKSLDITFRGEYKCHKRHHIDIVNGVISVATDVYAIVIPVIIVRSLNMATPQKVVLYAVFCCGLAVVGAGIARTYFLSKMFTDPRRDLTWNGHDLLMWGFVEMEMGLICASAPAMKGFFIKVGEKVIRYGTRGGSSGSRSRFKYGGRSYATKDSSGDPDSSALTSDKFDLTRLTPSSDWQDKNEKPFGTVGHVATSSKASNVWIEPPSTTLECTDSEKAWKNWLNISHGGRSRTSPTPPARSPTPVHPRSAAARHEATDAAASRKQSPRTTAQQDRDHKTKYPATDYVQLNGSGIHVEQRWSVASLNPNEPDTVEDMPTRNAHDVPHARSRDAWETGAGRKF